MTRRVLDTLHESVTDTHCAECPSQALDDENGGLYCARYGQIIGESHDDPDVLRCTSCLTAESRAARMVEIDPEDAARGPFAVIGWWHDDSRAAAERIGAAIEERAAEAERERDEAIKLAKWQEVQAQRVMLDRNAERDRADHWRTVAESAARLCDDRAEKLAGYTHGVHPAINELRVIAMEIRAHATAPKGDSDACAGKDGERG